MEKRASSTSKPFVAIGAGGDEAVFDTSFCRSGFMGIDSELDMCHDDRSITEVHGEYSGFSSFLKSQNLSLKICHRDMCHFSNVSSTECSKLCFTDVTISFESIIFDFVARP